jgi:hypothetical protein
LAILSVALILLFVSVAIAHLRSAYIRLIQRMPGPSYIPLINGVIGATGLFLFPDPRVSQLWWLAFVLDWGCLPLALECLAYGLLVVRRRKE